MEKIIFNGEIYLKTVPSVHTKYSLKVSYIEINYSDGSVVTINRPKDLTNLPIQIIQDLEKAKVITKNQHKVWNNSGFYQLFTDGTAIYMISKESHQATSFNSLKEAEQEFTSLENFMKSALYIGRQFSNGTINSELLYIFSELYLLRFPSDEYYVIDKNNPLLTDFTIGDILPMYYEKESVKQAIIKQELRTKKENNGQKR